jgi:hypothetical protein
LTDVTIAQGAAISASNLTIGAASSLTPVIQFYPFNVSFIAFVLCHFNTSVGSFQSLRSAVAEFDPTSGPCVTLGTPALQLSPDSLSVLIPVSPCAASGSEGRLSPGVLAGIVVGSVVCGIAIAVSVALISRHGKNNYTTTLRAKIVQDQIGNVVHPYHAI